jgi:hypothetical protein
MRFREKIVVRFFLFWVLILPVACSGTSSSHAEGGQGDSQADGGPETSDTAGGQAGVQADGGEGTPDVTADQADLKADNGADTSAAPDGPWDAPTEYDEAASDATDGPRDGQPDAGIDVEDASGGDGPINPIICGQMCEVVVELACLVRPTMDACITNCVSEASICPTETAGYYRCLAVNGPAALMCNAVVGAIRRTGFCDQEAANVGTCIANQ